MEVMQNGCHTENLVKSEEPANKPNESENLLHKEIEEALLEEARKRGLTECELHVSSGSAKGDNYMGIVAKVTVTGKNSDGENVQWNWIAKVAPQTDLYRKLLKIGPSYAREVYMYKLFDRFEEFQREKHLLHPFDAHPKFVFSYLEPYKESFVMEDMKAIGYVLRDRKVPLDLNHVKLAMIEYGRFHAVSFAWRDQKPEEFQKIAKEADEAQFTKDNEEMIKQMAQYEETFNQKILAAMNEETDAAAIEDYKYFSKDANNIVIESIKMTSQYSVIAHGDCWANNFLWKYADSNNPNIPSKICILDWQLARYGSPAHDLSYFFYSCTDQKFREEHYDQMIKLYYHTLCANLVEMGSDPEKLFPFSALEAELKRYSVFGFHMARMVLQMIVSETNEVPQFAQSENVDDFMQSFDYTSVNDHLFKERVRGIVLHMHQKGYFDFLREKNE